MELTPEERAMQALSSHASALARLSPSEVDALKRSVEQAMREAIAAERLGLRATLRLCKAAFDETLLLKDVPQPLRAVARVCKGLCLEGLGEEEAGLGEKEESNVAAADNRSKPRSCKSPS